MYFLKLLESPFWEFIKFELEAVTAYLQKIHLTSLTIIGIKHIFIITIGTNNVA